MDHGLSHQRQGKLEDQEDFEGYRNIKFPERWGERERDREMGREREREQERAAESNAKRLVSGTPFHPYCYIPPGQPSPLPPPVPSGGADMGAYGPTP